MKFYKTNNSIKALLISAFIFIALFVLTSSSDNVENSDELINSSFTREALIEEIKCHDFKYPDLILAQAVLESGHFKSSVFKENNNLFGMRQPRKRFTLCKGSNLNHGVYDNWKISVEDRMIYDTLYLKDLTRTQYLKFLDNVYCKSGYYSRTLENLIKKNDLKECFNE
jgi:uncharacterized FlgJ-related protein